MQVWRENSSELVTTMNYKLLHGHGHGHGIEEVKNCLRMEKLKKKNSTPELMSSSWGSSTKHG